jgi:prepilin peptidase CpaA
VWTALLALALCSTLMVRLLRHEAATGLFLPIVTLLVCLLAAGFDAATSTIPNPLTYTAILAGLAVNTAVSGLARGGLDLGPWLGAVGAAQAFVGFGVCAAIGLLCLLLAGMGGGDVKLLVAVGTLLGFSQATHVFLWTLAIAVPYALLNLLIRGRLNGVLAAVGIQLLQIVYLRRWQPISAPSRTTIPLAVPLTAALFCARVVPQEAVARWLGGA